MNGVPEQHSPLSTRCRCEVRQGSTRACISVTGEVDLSNAEELTRVVVDALRAHRPQRLRLDLDGVTFLGAAGARALVRGRIEADREGCTVEIGKAEAKVEKVLALCGVRADPLPSGAGSGST